MAFFAKHRPIPDQLNIALISQFAPLFQSRPSGVAGGRRDSADDSRGSGPSFLRLIARGLAFRGHSVTIITGENLGGATNVREADGVRIVSIAPSRISRLRSQAHQPRFQDLVRSKFLELHREAPFHLVHALDSSAVRVGMMKRDHGFAMAYDVQATHLADLFAIMGMGQETLGSILGTGFAVGVRFLSTYFGSDRRLLATADGVFAASPRERISLERYYLYPDSKIHNVPYGIEIGAIKSNDELNDSNVDQADTRAWRRIPLSTHVAVTVSDMHEIGEMQNLLRAFERVAIQKPNSRLIVIGDGPRFKDIEFEALMLALGSKVIFAGELGHEDQVRAISRADVFVNLSARTSGFEPSLLEAMAQKKVVIGSEMSPMAAMLEHGLEGFLVRPADVSEITELLLAVFERRLPIQQIGEAARAKITALFDPEKMVVETLKAYRSILEATGRYRRTA